MTSDGPYDLINSLGYQITLLSRVSERLFEKRLAPLGLTRVNWCVLLAVHQQQLANPSDIASFVGIDRTATSRALRKLEEDGFIQRCSGSGDRRKTEVLATGLGRQCLEQANIAAQHNADHFSGKLSRYERDSLNNLLGKLMDGEARNVKGL